MKTTSVVGTQAARVQDRPMLGEGEHIADRFRVVRILGRGGMGQVFEAEDLALGTAVALKVIYPARVHESNRIDALRHEVQLARQVTHRNVCRTFDLFQHRAETAAWGRAKSTILVVSMELLRGETLAAHLSRGQPLSTPRAINLLRQIAEGLDTAHAAGVVHGDLSASNVMIVPDGEAERAVIMDFGLAQQTDGTERPWTGGTPLFLAPELVDSRARPTPASDCYALAVLAHQLLRGGPPGAAKSLRPVRRRVAAALRRGLDPSPDERFASAGELLAAMAPRSSGRRWAAGMVGVALLTIAVGSGRFTTSAELETGAPKSSVARAHYEQGLEALEQWRHEAALSALDAADAEEPGSPLIAIARAELWALYGDRNRARIILEDAMAAVATGPRELRLRVEGHYREITRDWQRAEEIFRALVTLFPERSGDVERLATVLSQVGKPLEAITLLEEASAHRNGETRPSFDLVLARAARARADLPLQRQAAARARQAAEATGAVHLAAEAGLIEAEALFRMGHGAEADQRLAAARAEFERLGDRYGLARITLELSDRRTPQAILPLSHEEALVAIQERDDPILEARMLLRLARTKIDDATVRPVVLEQIERAKELVDAHHDWQAATEILNLDGLLHWNGERVEEAEVTFADAVKAAEASGNLRLLAGMIGNHARILMHLGQREASWLRHEESIAAARRCGCRDVLVLNLHTAAIVARRRDDLETADRMVRETLTIAESSGDIRHLRFALAADQDRLVMAGQYQEALDRQLRQLQLPIVTGLDRDLMRGGQVRLLTRLERYAEAEAIVRDLIENYPLASGSTAAIRFHLLLADIALRDPARLGEADRILAEVIDQVVRHDTRSVHLHAARLSARLESRMGRPSLARQKLIALASPQAGMDASRPNLLAQLVLGRMLHLAEETDHAREVLQRLIADPAVARYPWIVTIARDQLDKLAS
ncbi:MAG: protein kinase [Thermoanaerobaculia bacterium]|nr:protein kinase [Thermoanaerobaculia bacterium]